MERESHQGPKLAPPWFPCTTPCGGSAEHSVKMDPHVIEGTSIDLGIAYILMLVALVLTYLIHPLDASSPYKLF
uniref:AGP16 n=2 Tax=Zea mays TaxID=4577 RepID=A0A804P2F6_MAIZE